MGLWIHALVFMLLCIAWVAHADFAQTAYFVQARNAIAIDGIADDWKAITTTHPIQDQYGNTVCSSSFPSLQMCPTMLYTHRRSTFTLFATLAYHLRSLFSRDSSLPPFLLSLPPFLLSLPPFLLSLSLPPFLPSSLPPFLPSLYILFAPPTSLSPEIFVNSVDDRLKPS
jgi:hypothetical protein